MKIVVLGGLGIQGRAAVMDLAESPDVKNVICADARLDDFNTHFSRIETGNITPVEIDANDQAEITALLADGVDVVVDLLPRQFMTTVCNAAAQAGVHVVFTNYAGDQANRLDRLAKSAGIAVMPECGLDPGIDLVIYGEFARRFDRLEVIDSYCGGFPEKSARDNPLNYKISWTWEGVQSATIRDARMISGGRVIEIPAASQHAPENIHAIAFNGLGELEAIPNGDAVYFTDRLGVTDTIRKTGRYSLRWPGWSAFWHPLKQLGFLDHAPVPGLPGDISPYRFLSRHLGSRLFYQDDEKDLVAMVNVFKGRINGNRKRFTVRLFIERDLKTGLMAMAQGVGFPAAIVARMIGRGEISETGLLSPMVHVPYRSFFNALTKRGIMLDIEEKIVDDSTL